jgi:hypothetical protein
LIITVIGSYLAVVFTCGVLYWAFDLTNGKGFLENLYFSLVTQATVGYGDVLPTGFGRPIASVQIAGGVIWAAFLPALVLIRLSKPHPETIRFSTYVAFDPATAKFRFKLANTGRFVGSGTSIQPWLRVVHSTGRRTLPVAIRTTLPVEARFPHLRPLLATGYQTEAAGSPDLPAGIEMIHLHPAHFTADSKLIIDASIETPFGTSSQTVEFDHSHVVCGKHLDVQEMTDGPQDWAKIAH